ncbi:MAG: hypothetical protein RLZZ74_3595 [Cyanobacteriota bacterium]|jgi:archaellum component FlaC
MASSCEEIDAALGRLGGKIDGLNNTINGLKGKLNALEKEQARCCKNKQDKDIDLTPIYKRIVKLEDRATNVEKTVLDISKYVNVVESAVQSINNLIGSFFR